MFWIIVLISVVSYILSFYIARWLNKILYIKYGSNVIPILWQIPILNTLTILVLTMGIISEVTPSIFGPTSAEYYKHRWRNEIK